MESQNFTTTIGVFRGELSLGQNKIKVITGSYQVSHSDHHVRLVGDGTLSVNCSIDQIDGKFETTHEGDVILVKGKGEILINKKEEGKGLIRVMKGYCYQEF